MQILVLLSCLTLASANGGQARCNRKPIEDKFRKCLRGSTAKATCKTNLETAMQSCGAPRPDTTEIGRLSEAAAQTELADCKMRRTQSGCDTKYASMTGKTLPSDATEKKNFDRFEAARGASKALGDKMKNCTNPSACRDTLKQDMADLKGRTGGNYTESEFAYDLKKAGAREGGDFIQECVGNATNATEKQKCFGDQRAREAFAGASGKSAGDVNFMDMKKAGRESGTKSVRDIMDACVSAATSDTEKKACRQRSDLKSMIADSEGKMKGSIKDSKVMDTVKKGARSDLLTAAKTCEKTDLAKCKTQMKNVYAKAAGKKATDISDDDMKRSHKQVLARDLGDRMSACVEEAGSNSTAIEACRALAKSEMQRSDYESSSRTPSKGEVEKTLRNAGKVKAGEAMEDCDSTWTRDQCLASMKDRVAKSMGKKTSDLKAMDAEVLNRAGAFTAAKDIFASCADAKKDNASATCDDFHQKYLDMRGMSKPTDPKSQERQKNAVKQGAAVDAEKSVRGVCFEKSTKAAADVCLAGFRTSQEDTMKQIYANITSSERAKRAQTAGHEANREVLGDDYIACMKGAGSVKADKDSCMTALRTKKGVAGETQPAEDVLKMYRGQEIAKASLACVGANAKKTCRSDAKSAAVSTGMKEREWAAVKSTGEKEAAAKAWSACKLNSTATDTGCEADAKVAFEAVSGTTDQAAWDAVKAQVTKLGKAKRDGKNLKMVKRKQIDVDVGLSATACSVGLTTAFHNKVTALLAGNKLNNRTLSNVSSRGAGCRVVDGHAELSASIQAPNMSDAEIDNASDTFQPLLVATSITEYGVRRLSEDSFLGGAEEAAPRHLATYTVQNAYASQGSELCAEDDSSCGVEASSPSPTPSSSPAGQTKGTAGTAWRSSVGIGFTIAMLLLASAC